jgi:hypothetical protein
MNHFSKLTFCLFALAFLSIASLSVSAQQFASRVSRASTLPPTSTISTLYSNDPIAHALCFTDGQAGGTMENGGVFNRCSHIDFDAYKAGNLSVAIEGGEIGRIIDLGTPDELSKQYGYQETIGKGQGFASIEFSEGKVLILKDRYKSGRQELSQAARLFEKGESNASAEAKAGHIYLARITDRHKQDFQILVKLLVLSVRPGESVTFRWQLL